VQLEHSFSIPAGIDEAWKILLDVERIGPCLPGTVIQSVDGDAVTGTVKVKLGPINLTYKGTANFVEKDETAHRAVVDAQGRDARGTSTAAALVTARLSEEDGTTTVHVNTELDITGKPAQFGHSVMADVGSKLLGQFADALAATLRGPEPEPAAGESSGAAAIPAGTADTAAPVTASAQPDDVPAAPEKARPRPARRSDPEAAQPADGTEPPAAEQPVAATEPAPEPAAATEPAPGPAAAAQPNAEAVVPAPTEAADDATPAYSVPGGIPAARPDAVSSVSSVNGHPPLAQGEVESVNLLETAGPALAKRLAPVAVAAVVVLLAMRRRSAHRG
jgi:carbon monoxide dehydrogenase subunit G